MERRMGRSAALALAWGLTAAGPALADTASVEADYMRVREVVDRHSDGYWMKPSIQGEHALARSWSLIAQWTAAYLNEHPHATTARLKHAAPTGADSRFDVIAIAPRTYLVASQFAEIGTVFIVDGTDGEFRPAWSIRKRENRGAFPLLAAWGVKETQSNCDEGHEEDGRGRCGPIFGDFALLPAGADDRPRFIVYGTYAQAAETTVGGQLSIWSWTGTTAVPLFVKRYAYNFEDMNRTFEGGLLKIRATDYYRTFFPCGTCIGRQMDWTLRVGPDKIEDLGMTPVVPETDMIDELFFRVWHRQPADDLAAPEVLAQAAAVLNAQSDTGVFDPGDVSLGMMGDTSVRHRAKEAFACLTTDDVGPLLFTIEEKGGRPFISGVAKVGTDSDRSCPRDKP